MTGFKNNNLRESVSLMHSFQTNTETLESEQDPVFTDHMTPDLRIGLSDDDNLIILDELKQVSRRSLILSSQLQQRLRNQHLNDLACASTNITIGEGKLVSELKIANDNLRWRLQQKCRTAESYERLAENLKTCLEDFKNTMADKDEEIANLKEELSRYRDNLSETNTRSKDAHSPVNRKKRPRFTFRA